MSDENEIKRKIRAYFQDLFSSKGSRVKNHLLNGVRKTINLEDNIMLTKAYTIEKLERALKSMGLTKVSRDDGFLALLYQHYWHIVGQDISYFCLQILNKGMTLDSINTTNTVLIPKSPHPINMTNC